MNTMTIPALLAQKSKPVKMKPVLYTVNGIGFGFAGIALRHAELGEYLFVRMHWFKLVFVPVLPLGIYLLENPLDNKGRFQGGSYYIHRAVQIGGVTGLWGAGKFWGMLLSAWGIALAMIGAIAGAVLIIEAISKAN